ncbi:MAG: hypothetical protein NVSMB62_17050 [Acidobacteriaceae bacterium]
MLKLVLFAPGFLFLGLVSQQTAPVVPATPAAPPAPAKVTPESLTHARKMYAMDCAMCHGATGDGKGELVGDLKLTLKDYSDPASLAGLSDAQIFDIISTGKGQMPGEGARLKPDQVWSMVSLVRSFAKK